MKKIKLLVPTVSLSALAAIAMPLTSCGTNSSGEDEGSATEEITKDTTITSGTYESTKANSNALMVKGKVTANISNVKLNKTGDCTDTEKSSFYGTNSALLAKGGATVNLDKLTVTTDALGANGVFAYGGKSENSNSGGDGTNITIKNSTINTTKGNSGGVMVAGHASLTATDCTVTTAGDSSAPIRSDRGGESMTISGGTYTSSGKGSPAIYATATIKATDATLTSNHSEGVIVEGSNFVTLKDCDLEDTNDELNGQSTTYKNIFLYQSVSGDAGTGSDGITITGGSIKTHYGDDFYVTNQTSTINLEDVEITNDFSVTTEIPKKYFLRAQKDAWGKTGENGGKVTLNATNQTIGSDESSADIYIDAISTLALNLKEGSEWTGCLTTDNKSTTGVVVTIDSDSTWTLTDDSYIGNVGNSATLDRIDVNGHKLYGWSGSDWEVIKE